MTKKKQDEEVFSPEDWVNVTVARAVQVGASDVHIEVLRDRLLVRFRVDGVLQVMGELPPEHAEHVIARLKVLGKLNSAEHRLPQEGHAVIELPTEQASNIDSRISIFPTLYGETAVLRILNRSEDLHEGFEELGMSEEHAKTMNDIIRMPFGMVLATGPTGSGKTTLLYTALSMLEQPERNVVTLEDPVERQFPFIRQSQVNNAVGLTYPVGLRSILRQDPDVVMIGEIRDRETAEISSRAALTGRLLFSTLHTKDTIGAITRLLDYEIPRSIIASALRLVVNSRLIRRICPDCAAPAAPSQTLLEEASQLFDISNVHFVSGEGCEACGSTGYRGRISIFEILRIDRTLEQAIIDSTPVIEMRRIAQENGMQSLRSDAIAKAAQGLITLEDAIHTTAL